MICGKWGWALPWRCRSLFAWGVDTYQVLPLDFGCSRLFSALADPLLVKGSRSPVHTTCVCACNLGK